MTKVQAPASSDLKTAAMVVAADLPLATSVRIQAWLMSLDA